MNLIDINSIIYFLGLSVLRVSEQPVQKKVTAPRKIIEPRKKLIYSLICNGESDRTPLLKRKYKSKGIKEFCLLIETPDFGRVIYTLRNLRTDTFISYSSSDLTYYYRRGPPAA